MTPRFSSKYHIIDVIKIYLSFKKDVIKIYLSLNGCD